MLTTMQRNNANLCRIPRISFTLGPNKVQRLQLSRHVLSSRSLTMFFCYKIKRLHVSDANDCHRGSNISHNVQGEVNKGSV